MPPNPEYLVGTGGALVTTLSFLPQLVRVRRQGGRDLSLAMLAMYLTGSGLWLVYGVLNGAIAVIAANVVGMTLVSAIALLKIGADRRAPVTRRLRIAIDMDEVMADALAEHVRRYNAHFGATTADCGVCGAVTSRKSSRPSIGKRPRRCWTLPSSRTSRSCRTAGT